MTSIKNPLTIKEKEGRIELSLHGSLTHDRFDALKESVASGKQMIKDNFIKTGRMIEVLLDMTEYSGVYDVEAMEILADFADANREFVRKTACFGGGQAAVLAGEVVIAMAERRNIQFFDSKEKACEWLNT